VAGTDRHPESPQIPDSPAGFPGQGEVLRNVTVVRCPHAAVPSDATYVGKGQPASHIISTMTSIGAVLTSISNPSERQIIAVLGLIYVTIRTQAIFQGIGTSTVVADFQKQIDQIRYFVDGNFELPNRDRQIALLEAQQAKLFIDAFFLSVISLACLVAFFTAQ
jgi:hypothetical protein